LARRQVRAKAKAKQAATAIPVCTEVALPEEQWLVAAQAAIALQPANAPMLALMEKPETAYIGVLTTKWWGEAGKELTVGFLDRPSSALASKVLAMANRWGEFCNVKFHLSQTSPDIRVSFGPGGYWSHLGTDCRQIPAGKPTMNLENFTLRTPESEWVRVVCHEFGHALGCPHEQQRQAILDLLDERKTIAYFKRTQGWSEAQVRSQILTPLEERSFTGSPRADMASIMCYSFDGSCTKSGKPIPGGADFSQSDREHMAKIYPRPGGPTPVPPEAGEMPAELWLADVNSTVLAKYKKATS
jgi:hypothetical protein